MMATAAAPATAKIGACDQSKGEVRRGKLYAVSVTLMNELGSRVHCSVFPRMMDASGRLLELAAIEATTSAIFW
jgi:hypothetical protein